MAVATSTLAGYEIAGIYGVTIVADSGFRVPFYRYVEHHWVGTGWSVFVTVILSVGRAPTIHGSGDVVIFESHHQTH